MLLEAAGFASQIITKPYKPQPFIFFQPAKLQNKTQMVTTTIMQADF